MLPRRYLAIFSIGLSLASYACEEHHVHIRPDDHAPISVMTDHTHQPGDVMMSYRYMSMTMNDVLHGSDDISKEDIYSAGYMSAPSDMDMSMHMLGLMWGLPHNITLAGMVPYLSKSMTLTPNPMMAGAIDQTDTMPNNMDGTLGYGMHLGSGTFDLLPSFTAVKFFESLSVGTQLSGVIRLGENDKGYTLGNEGNIATWVSKQWCASSSSSLQLSYHGTNPTVGRHSDISNENMSHVVKASNSGRSDLLLGIGNNLIISKGFLKDYRVGLDFTLPLTQSVDGIQMKLNSQWTLGVQNVF